MAVGNRIASIVTMLTNQHLDGNVDPLAVRKDLLLAFARTAMLTPISQARAGVDADIGYACGFLPPDVGNAMLTAYGVRHPYFGDKIPTDIEAIFMAASDAWTAVQDQRDETELMDKRAAIGASIGEDLPELGEAVDNDKAASVLAALRAKREREAAAKKDDESDDAYIANMLLGDVEEDEPGESW